MKHHSRWLVLLPTLIVLLVYLPALDYEFVWDEPIFLRDSPLYRDPALFTQALTEPFVFSPNYFRPVGVLAFIVELRLEESGSTLFHLASVLLHVINAMLIATLARYVCPPDLDEGKRFWLQIGAGLLYGLHPALVEGVAFVSSQFDLLATLFLLLALLADVSIRHRAGRPLAVGLGFFLAALSKEMALSFVLILPLWHLAHKGRSLLPLSRLWRDIRKSGDLSVYAAALVAGAGYLVLRYAALGYVLFIGSKASIPVGNALQHLLLIGRSVARYVVLMIWPFTNQTPIHYSSLPVPAGDLVAWVSLVVVLALLAGLVTLVRRVPRSGWLALAGTLSLLPVINIFPLELDGGAFVAQRFLLLPLTLFTLALIPLVGPLTAMWKVRLGRIPEWIIPLSWLVVSVATIQLTLPHWRDDLALWTWGARRVPSSWLPPTNLATAYNNRGSYQLAMVASDRALTLDPERANAWNNLGLSLFSMGNYAEAQAAFEEAVRREPDFALYLNNLAAALREQDHLEEAERILLEQVLPKNPALPVAHLNLGIIYLRADRPDLAAQHLQEALRLSPPDQTGEIRALMAQLEDPLIWLRGGDRLLGNGDPEGAMAAFEQASRLGANAIDVAVGRGAALTDLDALSEAQDLVEQALEQAPNDARLYNILGVIARKQGDLDAAEQHFTKALSLAPEWETPLENLQSLESGSP